MSHVLVRLPHSIKRLCHCLVPALLAALLALTPARAQNYLHTSGARIVDSTGATVRLTGLNWFGLESSTYCPHGLWARSMGSMLDQIKSLGYNCLRVPYSNQLFDPGSTPNGIDFSLNADLVGLTGPQVLDKLIAGCKARGLKVILDRHRPDAGGQSPLWYTDHYSEQRWTSDWTMLAARYAGNDTVIGFDLHNEPHDPATWGSGVLSTDWQQAAQRCGNAVLAVNPHLLIIVEGIQTVGGDGYWWGGNLEAAGAFPVQLSVPNQLVYSTHDYPSTVSGQPWFSAPNYPSNLPGVWDHYWGYLVRENIAPVYVGEFGTLDQTTSDQQWFQSMANYIGANGLSFTFWAWNPNSTDTGGILGDDWQTVNQAKQSVLQPLLASLIGGGGGGPTVPASPAGLTATAGDGRVTLSWNASSGAATYNLYRSPASGMEGTAPYKTGIAATGFTDTVVTNGTTYYYTVAAVNTAGTSVPSGVVSAKPIAALPAPGPPANLTATAGDSRIALSWTAPAGPVTGYTLYRATSPGAEGTIPFKTGLTSPAFTDTGLTDGVTYYYTVTAVNSAGASPQSAEASAKPVAPAGGGTMTATPLVTSGSGPWWSEEDVTLHSTAPVTALTVTVTVQKTAGAIYAGQYNTIGSAVSSSHTDGVGKIVYQFSLAPGQTLAAGASPLFAAQFNGSGTARTYSGDAYAVTYTSGGTTATLTGSFGGPLVPAAPTSLTATAGDSQVTLTWSAPSGTVTGYTLYRATAPGAEGMTPYRSGLSGTGFTDTGLTDGVTYYYTVSAVNSAGASLQSAEASANPVAPGGSVTVSGAVTGSSGPWWGEEDVTVSNTAAVTTLTLTITVQKTAGATYSGQYNTLGGIIMSGHTDTGAATVYQFTLSPGQSLPPGADRLFAAQFGGNGTAHPYGADTYTVTSSIGGHTTTQSGQF